LRRQIHRAGFNSLLTAVNKFLLLLGFAFGVRVMPATGIPRRRAIPVNNFVDNNS
jgi:hypothetical protein